jgi:hypothetical protein
LWITYFFSPAQQRWKAGITRHRRDGDDMSPSSDIETLFGHFGGNAGDYQEIGRENEARTARTRWPLLVTLDLKQPAIPAIAQRRDPLAKHVEESGQAQSPDGDAPATANPVGTAEARVTGAALLRGKAPLFARPHRRSIPPIAKTLKADTPRGAERFSSLPEAIGAKAGANQAEPVAAAVAGTQPAVAPVVDSSVVAPVAAIPPVVVPVVAQAAGMPSRGAPVAASLFAPPPVSAAIPPVVSGAAAPARVAAPPASTATLAARLAVPAAAPARPNPFAATARAGAPSMAAPAAPAAPTQPRSILGKLFSPAAPGTAPSAQPPTNDAPPAALHSVFDRLRGASTTPATPASHSWLTNGPRHS